MATRYLVRRSLKWMRPVQFGSVARSCLTLRLLGSRLRDCLANAGRVHRTRPIESCHRPANVVVANICWYPGIEVFSGSHLSRSGPKHWIFSFGIISSEKSRAQSCTRMDWLILALDPGTLESSRFPVPACSRHSASSSQHHPYAMMEKPYPWLNRPLLASNVF